MNAAYIAVDAAAIAKSKKADDPKLAKNKHTSGILFMIGAAGFFFLSGGTH